MKSAKRWSRKAILAAGNIYAHDGEDDPKVEDDPAGGTEQEKDADGGADADKEFTPEQMKNKIAALKEEQDRQHKKWQADRKRADELQAKVDEVDRAKKSDLENAKADLDAKDKVIAAKDAIIRRLAIENAFVALPDITWNNPASALKLVDLSTVDFDEETGKPKDMKQLVAAARELAKTDPYLVRSKTAVSDDVPNGKKTGQAPKGVAGKDVSDEDLMKKYNVNR